MSFLLLADTAGGIAGDNSTLGSLEINLTWGQYTKNCFFARWLNNERFVDQSNNQVLKMQSQFNLLGDLNQRLSSMRGIEFIVYSEHPPDMWIIRKQRRNSPEDGPYSRIIDN